MTVALSHTTEAGISTGLVLAGFVPNLFSSQTLQIIYLLLVIPVAAYNTYRWVRYTVWPSLKTRFKF